MQHHLEMNSERFKVKSEYLQTAHKKYVVINHQFLQHNDTIA